MFDNFNKWFGSIDNGFSNLRGSVKDSGREVKDYIDRRTTDLTPTLTRALINSKRIYFTEGQNNIEISITYNEDGSAPYAIEQHNAPYSHDYSHNPTEVRGYKGGIPLLYVWRPLFEERENWWKIFRKVGWKR